MTSERRNEILVALDAESAIDEDGTSDGFEVGVFDGGPFTLVTRDELREALQAHEELETTIELLRPSNAAGVRYCQPSNGFPCPVLGCDCFNCDVTRLLATHDARTAGTAAKEGDSDAL